MTATREFVLHDSPTDVIDADKTCADSEPGTLERASRVTLCEGWKMSRSLTGSRLRRP